MFRSPPGERFESRILPGLVIKQDWLWEPKPMSEVLAELGLG